MAAGFDKNGDAVGHLLRMGFGFVEIGTVTPLPQRGNDKPRVFRLEEDKAVINRYGFNSEGFDEVRQKVSWWLEIPEAYKKTHCLDGILGLNIGKNKTSENAVNDYVTGIQRLGPLSNYIVLNISSPNTPGLRNMQAKEELSKLLKASKLARDNINWVEIERPVPPLLLKIAPDLGHDDLKDIADVVLEVGIDGIIVSNTTITRPESLIR